MVKQSSAVGQGRVTICKNRDRLTGRDVEQSWRKFYEILEVEKHSIGVSHGARRLVLRR